MNWCKFDLCVVTDQENSENSTGRAESAGWTPRGTDSGRFRHGVSQLRPSMCGVLLLSKPVRECFLMANPKDFCNVWSPLVGKFNGLSAVSRSFFLSSTGEHFCCSNALAMLVARAVGERPLNRNLLLTKIFPWGLLLLTPYTERMTFTSRFLVLLHCLPGSQGWTGVTPSVPSSTNL